MQLQQAQFTAIQVKQEYPTQNQLGTPNSISNDLKHQMVDQGHGQLQQMQLIEAPSVSPHHAPNSGSMGNPTTTISTMSPLQAIPTGHNDWGQGRLQLIQPPLSNQGYLYPNVIMSGNIIHSGIGQQPIQVIATGGNSANFSGSYTLPGMSSSQSQALVFSPVSVINSQPQQQQQNILPTMNAQQNNGKSSQQEFQKSLQNQKIIQKVNTNNTITNTQSISGSNTNIHSTQQCVQVSQAMPTAQILSPIQQPNAQSMQISSPWMQGVPHFWTNGIQPQTLLAQNPIIIRGTQSDGTQGMFIQQATTHHAIQNQQANPQTLMQCNIPQANKPKMQIEPINKQQQQPRTPLILPQNTQTNRPASNVSTQTAQNQNLFAQKQIKRNKQQAVRPALTVMKSDTSGQIKTGMHQVQQQHSMHQVVTSGGNKMVVVSAGQPINIQSSGNVQQQQQNLNTTDKQQIQMQQLKHQQSLIHQQQLQHQIMQQNPNQQLFQHQIAQQIHLQQQSQQQVQQHVQSGMQSGQFLSQHHQQQNQFTTNHEQREQPPSGVVHQIVVQQNQQHQLPQVSNVTNISPVNTASHQSLNVQSKHISIPLEKQKCNVNCQQQPHNPNVSIITSQTPSVPNTICSEPLIASSVPSSVSLPLSTSSNTILAMTTFTTSVLPTTTISTGLTSSTSLRLGTAKPLDSSIKPEPNTITEKEDKEKMDSNSIKLELNKSEEKNDGTVALSLEENTKKDMSKNIFDDDMSKTVNIATDDRIKNEASKIINSEDTTTRSCVKIKNTLKNEKDLPKAMIKPNVLTHVIEGFVIQEGSEPFSVTRIRYSEKDNLEEPPNKRQALNESAVNSDALATAACENCGKKELRSKLKRKRFCSSLCVHERKTFNEDDQNLGVSNSTGEITKLNEPMEVSSQNLDKPKGDLDQNTINVSNPEECPLMQWSVSDVCDFIKNLPGCNDYADDFALQEIDGQALLLLKENHLVNAMGMKLGPALKIVAKVESMKEGHVEKETH